MAREFDRLKTACIEYMMQEPAIDDEYFASCITNFAQDASDDDLYVLAKLIATANQRTSE